MTPEEYYKKWSEKCRIYQNYEPIHEHDDLIQFAKDYHAEQLCLASVVGQSKNYVVLTPEQKTITVEEYMETDDYNNKLEQQISDFMTNKREKELVELFKKR